MREPISLKEILAVVVKRGWGIIAAAVAVAVVLGGYQFSKQMELSRMPENSAQQIEQEYKIALEEYNVQMAALEELLEEAESVLSRQREYNSTSILMTLDPYNVPKNIMVFSLSDLTAGYADGTVDQSEDRYARMLEQVQSLYDTYWNVADFTKELRNSGLSDLDEKYIREMIEFKHTRGGTITVAVCGRSVAEVEQLANAIKDFLLKTKVSVEQQSYSHKLTMLKSKTKIEISTVIVDHQKNSIQLEKNNEEEVTNLKTQIENLQVPQKRGVYSLKEMLKATIKWAILGFAVGGMLACVWVLVLFMFRSRVESSRQMEQVLGIPFLGSVAEKGDVFHRLADWMLVERAWKDPAEAEAFLAKSLQAAVGEAGDVLVLTTLQEKTVGSALNSVEKAAAALGMKAVGLQDAERNPKTAEALRGCKRVVLAERVGVSDVQQMKALLDIAQRMETTVIGFVTI